MSFPPFVPAAAALHRAPLPVTITGAGPIDLPPHPPTHASPTASPTAEIVGSKKDGGLFISSLALIDQLLTSPLIAGSGVTLSGGEGRVRFLPTLDGLRRRSINGGPVCVEVVAESIIWSHLNEVELVVFRRARRHDSPHSRQRR